MKKIIFMLLLIVSYATYGQDTAINKRGRGAVIVPIVASSVPLSGVTAATGSNSISNGNNTQTWDWNSLTSNLGLVIKSTSTGLSGGTALFKSSIEGTTGSASQTTFAANFNNQATGTTNTNVALNLSATGGTNNYALLIPNGKVGINNNTPATCALVDITSTTQGLLLPRMTKTQRDAISSPVAGLAIYQTDNTPGLRVYNGTNWMRYTETAD